MHLIAPTATIQVPDWVVYPDRDWVQITPAEAGLDARKFAAWLASLDVRGASFGGEDHSGNQYGAVLTRGGYLMHAWGDPHYRHQTASVGKALTWVALGAAVGDGPPRPGRADPPNVDRSRATVAQAQIPRLRPPPKTHLAPLGRAAR